MSETKTNFKNELKSAASLILTFSLLILQHYYIHQNAPKDDDVVEEVARGESGDEEVLLHDHSHSSQVNNSSGQIKEFHIMMQL